MTDSKRQTRRRFLQVTGSAAAAVALAGCTGDGGDGEDTTTGGDGGDGGDVQMGGTLQLINATMTTLDPVANTDTAGGVVIAQVYEALTTYPNGESSVENKLASEIETSDDFTEYTITLKDGVTFHNGDDLTASDIVYSLERLAQSENSNRTYFILDSLGVAHETDDEGNYVPDSLGVSAEDDSTVVITLAEPFHQSLQMLAYSSFAAVPEGIVGDIEGYDGEMDYQTFANSNPVGTGPFAFEQWTQGDNVSVTKNEEYHVDGEPYLDGIHWAIIEEDEPSFRYGTNKNSDLLSMPTAYYDPNKVSVDRTENGREFGTYGPLESGNASGETVNYYRIPTLTTYYLAFDVSNTPKAVRQAVAYAVNRREIAQSVFKNRYPPAYHLTPPAIYPGGAEAYDQHVQDSYPYGIEETQIDEAKRVMEEAGYGPDNNYQLTFNAYQSQTYVQLVEGLRDKLSAAHIEIEVTPTDFSTIIQKGNDGTLQAYTLGWIADWPAPDNFVQLMAPPNTNVGELGSAALTYTNWSEIDTEAKQNAVDAWDKIQNNLQPTEAGAQARAEGYVALEEANWEDVVLINFSHAASERFWYDNVHLEPFGVMGASRQTHNTTWKEQ